MGNPACVVIQCPISLACFTSTFAIIASLNSRNYLDKNLYPSRFRNEMPMLKTEDIMDKTEIRAKALELAINSFRLLPADARVKMLSGDTKIQQTIINSSRIFEEHILNVVPKD
jgi:hypothetical protein